MAIMLNKNGQIEAIHMPPATSAQRINRNTTGTLSALRTLLNRCYHGSSAYTSSYAAHRMVPHTVALAPFVALHEYTAPDWTGWRHWS